MWITNRWLNYSLSSRKCSPLNSLWPLISLPQSIASEPSKSRSGPGWGHELLRASHIRRYFLPGGHPAFGCFSKWQLFKFHTLGGQLASPIPFLPSCYSQMPTNDIWFLSFISLPIFNSFRKSCWLCLQNFANVSKSSLHYSPTIFPLDYLMGFPSAILALFHSILHTETRNSNLFL